MTLSDPGSSARRNAKIWAALGVISVTIIAVALIDGLPADETTPTLIRADPTETYDPVEAGEPPPEGFRQLLTRDQIAPVYDPEFTSADTVDWPQDMLVLAISGTSESKAYPVTHLNQREMVIDHIDGEPILVSW
jgi:hypothetical protein